HVARLLRHRAAAEVVDRRLLEALEPLSFLCRIRLDVGQQRADVGVRDPRRGRPKLERLRSPRHTSHLDQAPALALVRALEHRRLRVEAEQLRDPPKVRLEDLSDVHSARYAERIEDDVDRPAIRQERHVFLRHDAGNDTLVAVTSGHLVSNRYFALLGQINLHELDDARGQLIRLQNAVDALFRLLFDLRLLVVGGIDDLTDALVDALVLDAKRLEIDRRELHVAQRLRRHLRARWN